MLGCHARCKDAHSIIASRIELHEISDETIVLLDHHSMVCVVALEAVRREQEVPTNFRNMFWYGDTTGHLKDYK